MSEQELRPLSAIKLVRVCARCYPDRPPLEQVSVLLVSPSGLVHHGAEYGQTECGHDATGPRWWWAV